MAKASIIVPTFNCEPYVEQTILSVLRQTERDIEIIVVDDGSTDGTLAVLNRLGAADNRIRVFPGVHTGYPGPPRNRGLTLASGEFISFLDGDDLYQPKKIANSLTVLESIPEADLVFHDFTVFENDPSAGSSYLQGHAFVHAAAEHLTPVAPKTYLCEPTLYRFMSLELVPFHMSSVIFRRSLLDADPTWFRKDIRVGDDGDFWLRLAMRCKAVFLDEVLSFYRKRPGSISSDPVDYMVGAIQIHTENLARGETRFSKSEKRLYRGKIAALHFDLGYAYFCRLDRRQARKAYRKSLHTSFTVRGLAAYLKTFTPETLLHIRRTGIPCSAVPARRSWSDRRRHAFQEDSAEAGRNDVRLARQHPDLRRAMGSTSYSEDGYLKRKIKRLGAQMPVPFEFLTGTACWFAERFSRIQPIRQFGKRIRSARRSVARLRGAVDEAGGWKAFEKEFDVAVPVLLYHNVGPFYPGSNPRMTISRQRFEAHIRWLKQRGYTGILPSDWLAWRREGKLLPEKPVMITFDDSYASFAAHALPVLEKYGFRSTVFAVQDWIGGHNKWYDKKYTVTLPCMTDKQMRRCAATGTEFGSHTCSHPDLRMLSDGAVVREMQDSARSLSSLLGRPVNSFAYPYGAHSKSVERIATQIFNLAFSCEEGLNALCTDPYLVRRKLLTPSDTLWDLAVYVKFGWSRNRLAKRWRGLRNRWRCGGYVRACGFQQNIRPLLQAHKTLKSR